MIIELRPEEPEDEAFLFALFHSVNASHFAMLPLPDTQKHAIVESQFRAQRSYYARQYSAASFHIVVCDGAPAGRLSVQRDETEIRIIDIAISPKWQRRGIATRLISDLFDEARAKNLPVVLQVEATNSAREFYLRLGFQITRNEIVYLKMEWRPGYSHRETGTPH